MLHYCFLYLDVEVYKVKGQQTPTNQPPLIWGDNEEPIESISFINATDIDAFGDRYQAAVVYVNSKGEKSYGNVSKEIMLYGQGCSIKNAGAYWYYSDNSDIVCSLYQTSELNMTDKDIDEVFFSVCGFDSVTDDMDTIYSEVKSLFYEKGGNGEIDGIAIASYQSNDSYAIVIGNGGKRPTENRNTAQGLYNKVCATAANILKDNLKASDSLKIKSIWMVKDVYGKYASWDVYYVKIEYSATNSFGAELDDIAYIGIDPKDFTMYSEMENDYLFQGFQYASDEMKRKHEADINQRGVPIDTAQVEELLH